MEIPSFQDPRTIQRILRDMRRVAVVGVSANESRPSYFVAYYLKRDVVNETEAARASESGMAVVMDRCMKIEHGRYKGSLQWAGMRTGVITARRSPVRG